MSRNCPLCLGGKHLTLRVMPYVLPSDSPLPSQTRIERCQHCGFVFANSDAQAADYLAHYQRDSIYAATEVRPGAGLAAAERAQLERRAARFSQGLTPGSLFIDIGAGAGGLLDVVRDTTHCAVLGIDPDPLCVRRLHDRGLDAEAGTLDHLPDRLRGHATVAALSHVLEHLWAPVEGVRQALSLLAPHGILYVETPDRSRYGTCPNVPFYYFDPEHINHFAPSDFAALAAAAGGCCIAQGHDTLHLPDGTAYPIGWGLIQAKAPAVLPLLPVSSAWPDVGPYIQAQEAELQAWLTGARVQLSRLPRPLLVWGTGSQAQRMLAEGLLAAQDIEAFIDSDPGKQGRRLLGRPVLAPAEAMDRTPGAPVVVLAARAASVAILSELSVRWPARHACSLIAPSPTAHAMASGVVHE